MKALTLANLISAALIHMAKLPLANAIGMAERKAKEPAVGAALAKPLSGSNAVPAYNVEVMRGQKRERIALNAITAAPIANPDPPYEEWSPVKLARRLGV
jgi:hypothetical protein